jgi:uncharacterized small protein (DUF1192 family)
MSEIDKLEQIGHAMMLAWGRTKKAQARMWGDWMTIGEGLREGRRWAMQQAGTNKPEGKGYVTAFGEWIRRFKVDDMDKSDRAKLLQLMEERPAVEEWRATLTDHERRNLNNPTIAWRKWTAATRVKKPPKPTLTDSVRALDEEQHTAKDKIAQLQRERDELKARITELEEEIAGLRDQLGKAGKSKPAAVQQQDDSTAAPERKAKTAKGKTTKAKAAELEWVEDQKGVSFGGDGRHTHTAQAKQGEYRIGPSYDAFKRMKFSSWSVDYSPTGKLEDRRYVGSIDGNYRTLEKAKAAAQRDYERQ